MLLAPALGEPPRAIAERLGEALGRAARAPPWSAWRSPARASSTCSWPTRWYLDALAALLEAGDELRRRAAETPAST